MAFGELRGEALASAFNPVLSVYFRATDRDTTSKASFLRRVHRSHVRSIGAAVEVNELMSHLSLPALFLHPTQNFTLRLTRK